MICILQKGLSTSWEFQIRDFQSCGINKNPKVNIKLSFEGLDLSDIYTETYNIEQVAITVSLDAQNFADVIFALLCFSV